MTRSECLVARLASSKGEPRNEIGDDETAGADEGPRGRCCSVDSVPSVLVVGRQREPRDVGEHDVVDREGPVAVESAPEHEEADGAHGAEQRDAELRRGESQMVRVRNNDEHRQDRQDDVRESRLRRAANRSRAEDQLRSRERQERTGEEVDQDLNARTAMSRAMSHPIERSQSLRHRFGFSTHPPARAVGDRSLGEGREQRVDDIEVNDACQLRELEHDLNEEGGDRVHLEEAKPQRRRRRRRSGAGLARRREGDCLDRHDAGTGRRGGEREERNRVLRGQTTNR